MPPKSRSRCSTASSRASSQPGDMVLDPVLRLRHHGPCCAPARPALDRHRHHAARGRPDRTPFQRGLSGHRASTSGASPATSTARAPSGAATSTCSSSGPSASSMRSPTGTAGRGADGGIDGLDLFQARRQDHAGRHRVGEGGPECRSRPDPRLARNDRAPERADGHLRDPDAARPPGWRRRRPPPGSTTPATRRCLGCRSSRSGNCWPAPSLASRSAMRELQARRTGDAGRPADGPGPLAALTSGPFADAGKPPLIYSPGAGMARPAACAPRTATAAATAAPCRDR